MAPGDARPPFPGPALATRIVGEVTPERTELVRKATVIVEDELKDSGAFQYLAVLHNDRVTGIRDNKRDYGFQIEIRCWESTDAVIATPTELPFEKLTKMAKRVTEEVPGVVSVTYNVTTKPPLDPSVACACPLCARSALPVLVACVG